MSELPDKLRPPRQRSSAAYASLFAPSGLREQLIALWAFRAEIDETLFAVTDAGVATMKRAWWAEEIRRLAGGEPRHPITVALAPATPQLIGSLETFLVAANNWQDEGRDGNDIHSFCAATGGSLAEASGEIPGDASGPVSGAARSAARDLGSAARATALARLARVAPGVAAALFGGDSAGAESAILQWADECFARGAASMPGGDKGRYRTLVVLAALYERLLRRLRRNASTGYVEVGTGAKLWTAWSAARAAGRVTLHERRSDAHAS